MSDTQTVWMILWRRATGGSPPFAPFEIADVVPEVANALQRSASEATRLIGDLLKELERLPDGQQFFAREGNAVVSLPEVARIHQDPNAELVAYPYEL